MDTDMPADGQARAQIDLDEGEFVDSVFHPGVILRDIFLKRSKMSIHEFSRRSGLDIDDILAVFNQHALMSSAFLEGVLRVFPGTEKILNGVQNDFVEHEKSHYSVEP